MNERQLNYIEDEISSVRDKTDSLHKQVDELYSTTKILNNRLVRAESILRWIINIAVIAIIVAIFL